MKLTSVKYLLILLVIALATPAFPPAPYHLFYGMVRDEYGNPIMSDVAEVILETATGIQVKTKLELNLDPGTNYRMPVPMDAGITSDLYKANALRTNAPFRMKVKIGNTTYLPMEMVADFSKLGQPGERTLLNLTLGEDTDGDGIPDAWERALIDFLGGNRTLADIRPGDDLDGNGLTNLQEYLAGIFPFDDTNGFALDIARGNAGPPILRFTAIRGRNYTLQGSADLKTWTPVLFKIPDVADPQDIYRAQDVRILQIQVVPEDGQPAPLFYRLMLR
jgi:hypothetical protein